jgi:hypothetical protein
MRMLVSEPYLIWWLTQIDCDRAVVLDSWPMYLYNQFSLRKSRPAAPRRLLVSPALKQAPQDLWVKWDETRYWTCIAASNADGIVIRSEDLLQVVFQVGLVTNFSMELPSVLNS